jgi:hypothetical protein
MRVNLNSMKRIRGFFVLTVPFSCWNVVTKAGQWRLLPDMVPRKVALETSWHRSCNQAFAAFEDVLRRGSDEEVVVVSKKRIVLSVYGRNDLESQFLDCEGNPLWKSVQLRLPTLTAVADSPAFFNQNQTDIAWVAISGAEKDVPCELGFLEKRARKNPDGLYGRLVARKNEILDYFRPGWKT